MKCVLPLVPVVTLAVLAVPFIIAEYDAESEPIEFEDGLFTFSTLDGTRVAAIEYDNDNAEEVVEIPRQVEHDGITYVVTALSCSFYSERITTVKIHEYISKVDPGLIREGSNIEAFIVSARNSDLYSFDGVLFDAKARQLLAFPKASTIPFYLVPESVSIIGESAFAGCNGLSSVNFYKSGLTEIGYMAFANCENLQYINYVDGMNTLPDTLRLIENEAFRNCPNLSSFVFPESLKIIGFQAFDSTSIATVNIPSEIVYIGDCAFGNCGELTTITSNSPTYIVEDNVLFEVGKDLRTIVTYPAGKPDAVYTIDNEVTSIADMAFAGTKYLKKVILPDGALFIPEGSFSNCTSLEEIDLTGIVLVDSLAFFGCTNLKTVTFGNGLTTIDSSAFERCGLEEVVLPSSITYIGSFAFSKCENLKKFTIPDYSLTEINYGAFIGCTNLEEIDLLSTGIILDEGSLNIAQGSPMTVDIIKPKKYQIQSNAVTDDLTTLSIHDIGERPYPMENLIGVAFCVLILILIARFFRKV